MSFSIADPRIRVSRTSGLTLTTAWQRLDFNAGTTDALNINSFGNDPVSGNPMVAWDTVNKIFKFYDQMDRNFLGYLFLATTAASLITRATLQYRCVIPNGVSPGVDYYFPFTTTGAYVDLGEITILSIVQNNRVEPIPLYASAVLRANGFGIDVRLSNALSLGAVASVPNAYMVIQPLSRIN